VSKRRWVWGFAAAVAGVTFVLWSSGLQGIGPLGDALGNKTSWIRPSAYTTSTTATPTLTVIFPWNENGFCYGQFSVNVEETETSVLVDDVESRSAHHDCADIASGGRVATVIASLARPLAGRSVVRADDLHPLAYVPIGHVR